MKNKGKRVIGKQLVFPPLFFTNEIFIKGRINDSLVDKVIEALSVLVCVYNKITVFLDENSGGDLLPAKRLYEKLIDLRKVSEITGIAGKQLSSAAFFVFQGFGVRFINPETEALIHNLAYNPTIEFIPYVTSRKKTHKAVNDEIDSAYCLQDYLNHILVKSSRITQKELTKMLIKKTILNAEQILQYGFADKIIYDPADLP
jgi:ATP-dependent protease ClpP protease subunit